MTRLLICALLCFSTGEVVAYNVYRLGGDSGNPWLVALSYEPGDYEVLVADGEVQRHVAVKSPGQFATWEDTLTEVVDSLTVGWLRPFFVPDTLNLARDGVRNRLSRGVSDNIMTSGSCEKTISQVRTVVPMFDNDYATAAFYTAFNTEDYQFRAQFYAQNSIMDLGADFPINRVRFFPRLGTDNPKIDEMLGAIENPRLLASELPREDFSQNFLAWYEVSGAHSSVNFAANCYWNTPDSPRFRSISTRPNAPNDPRLTSIFTDSENQDVVVDLHFPTRLLQWVAIRPLTPIRNWEIAEFQVFGHGFVPRMVYTTAVLDFGEPMAWGKIRWEGTLDSEAQLFIRTRTGDDVDPNLYWIPANIPGEFKELERVEYDRASITDRFITLDAENWSYWSSPYPWQAGLADSTVLPWEDGTPILSPGPSRYLQLQVLVLSTLEHTARLRELEVQFSSPAARAVVGEVWPLDVQRTESTTFTYSVRPYLETMDHGFDRLEIYTLTRPDTVRSVRVDGVEYSDQFAPRILGDRLEVGFPRLSGIEDTYKLIEVEFDAHVVRYGTEFTGWVFDSQADGVKQLINPGDATVDFPGNALGIRTSEIGAALFAEVSVRPTVFTPNGDGVNDEVRFTFQLHNVSTPRVMSLDIFDLSGRLVRRIEQAAIRGLFGDDATDPHWNGLDQNGGRVVPGVYVYHLSLDADGDTQEVNGVLGVSY